MIEEWRPVAGYEGTYAVSSLGRIRRVGDSVTRKAGQTWTHSYLVRGYALITLCLAGVAKSFQVHRLVAAAFLGPCPNGLHVNHKNGVKADNRADNLEYVTASQNNRHANEILRVRRGRNRGEPGTKVSDEQVAFIRALAGRGHYATDIAFLFGLSAQHVRDIRSGKKRAEAA